MKQCLLTTIVAFFVTSISFAEEPTFESLQVEFQLKVLSLLSEQKDVDLQAQIAKFGNETFGAHPDLIKRESEKRFTSLPEFPGARLAEYREFKTEDQFPLPPVETGWAWMSQGWNPEKFAGMAKSHILSRHLTPNEYGRLALINSLCPDKVYRLGKEKFSDLVVDSLGDLFVITVEMTGMGVCKPVSVKWMKPKHL